MQEHADAFSARKPKEFELPMLRAHANAGVLTATQLANAAGYASYVSANSHYGKLGRDIGEAIGLPLPKLRDGRTVWTCSLARGVDGETVIDGGDIGHLGGRFIRRSWKL